MTKDEYNKSIKAPKPRSECWESWNVVVMNDNKEVKTQIVDNSGRPWLQCAVCGIIKTVPDKSTKFLLQHHEKHKKAASVPTKYGSATPEQTKYHQQTLHSMSPTQIVGFTASQKAAFRNKMVQFITLDKKAINVLHSEGIQELLVEVYNLGVKRKKLTTDLSQLLPSKDTLRRDIASRAN